MNYEELLDARDSALKNGEKMPYGVLQRKQVNKKYVHVVELKPTLTESAAFCDGMKADCKETASLRSRGQLHFECHEDAGKLIEIELESGTFMTYSRMLHENPAVVAGSNFFEEVTECLFEAVSELHEKGTYYLCFSPDNMLVRKGGVEPLMLCHGSNLITLGIQKELYAGMEEYVAPETLSDGTANERSDVYSIGKFLESLFAQSSIPMEYKSVLTKATAENSELRYASVAQLRKAFEKRRSIRHSVLIFIAALVVAAVALFSYMEWEPEATDIEFVEPTKTADSDDPFENSFDPATGMIVDTLDTLTDEERRQMEEYQTKAEEIFRKRYQREADAILSKVYNKERMGANEKSFMSSTNIMAEELLKLQNDLSTETGVTAEKAGRMATEIIENLTKEKQEKLSRNGYQKRSDDE